jgi:TRAP-type C4-dicarboxylate transport system permease small subunit
MNRTLDILYWVVGLIAAGGAIWYFIKFLQDTHAEGDRTSLWIAIGAAVVACVCALLFFLRHMNQEEEIHITGD